MNELVDTTEMYLRTVYELEEEGIRPIRARIVERLHQSGPTVSQTVARMERDGLIRVAEDRNLELTPLGRERAMTVMRRHRLAERLLVDVVGLNLDDAHAEACRWEHVITTSVEKKLYNLLNHPSTSPYGTPIPALDELGSTGTPKSDSDDIKLSELALDQSRIVIIRQIEESIQIDNALLAEMRHAGIIPDSRVSVSVKDRGISLSTLGGENVTIPPELTHAILVKAI